jgi:hypothetical protein
VPAGKNRHLRECTLEELAALMKGAGLAVTSTGEHAHAKRWYQASYETGKGTGYGYVIELAMPPDAEPAHYPMFTLADLRKWIKGDRSIGQNLAYAIQDNWIICLAGYDADRTIAAFGQMTAPFAVGTRYDSFDGPDPANVPSDSRPLWLAKKLADLTYVELDLRIRAAGASAALTPERAEWRFALTADKHTGELRLFGKLASPEPLHERFMADLRARKAPFSYAEQPEAALVATGSGDFGTKAFLENVLGGMDVDVRSSA